MIGNCDRCDKLAELARPPLPFDKRLLCARCLSVAYGTCRDVPPVRTAGGARG